MTTKEHILQLLSDRGMTTETLAAETGRPRDSVRRCLNEMRGETAVRSLVARDGRVWHLQGQPEPELAQILQ